MVIKEIDEEKVINFNPTFIYYELSSVFKSSSSIPIILSIILLGLIVLLLEYFFKFEMIFIYNLYFKKIKKTQYEIQYENSIIDKLDNIFKSKIECINNKAYIVNKNKKTIPAKNLDNNEIGNNYFC